MKKLQNEEKQTLKNEVQFYLEKIEDLNNNLAKYAKNVSVEPNNVLSAYFLSGIYSCLEDIFEKIAKVYENRIENKAAWHSELLLRMRIPIDGIRPAVISENIYVFLDEFRGFRHIFRESYVFSLDADRISLLITKWKKNRERLIAEISNFVKTIR